VLYFSCFIPPGSSWWCPWATVHGLSFAPILPMRVSAFIDGFNLYHALDGTGRHYLKWLDLRALCLAFAPAPQHALGSVYYFSAYATWRANAYARHRAFIAALRARGVEPVIGLFKEKDRACRACGSHWLDHEEKETDVNIALHLLRDAQQDRYDRALLISGDSDLAPAVRMVRELFPSKDFRIIAPYGRSYSMDLVNAAGGVNHARRMKLLHVERALLPERVLAPDGTLIASRPTKYAPPRLAGT
jgi:uncharacterized LabA/DUF88 family protein